MVVVGVCVCMRVCALSQLLRVSTLFHNRNVIFHLNDVFVTLFVAIETVTNRGICNKAHRWQPFCAPSSHVDVVYLRLADDIL